VVAVQQRQAGQFRRRGEDEVYWPGAPVLALAGELALHLPGTQVCLVMDGYPAEQGAQVLDHALAVGRRAGTVEELQLGNRAHRDKASRGRLIPSQRHRARAHQPRQRARVDEELRGTHRR
jgi:hypothetical protein